MAGTMTFPRQALPDSRKGKRWQEACMKWGDSRTYMHYSPTRRSVQHKAVNYDLVNGILHMEDLKIMLNPSDLDVNYFPEKIQHFPIINSKLETLLGEELQRPFEWRAVVINPNAVSDIEKVKTKELQASLQELIEESSYSEEEYLEKVDEMSEYFQFDYKDARELRANEILKQYVKQYNLPLMFNAGMRDGLICGEECYFNDIVGGNPVVEKVNVNKLRAYRMGYSNRFEDADIIIMEDFWSPGRILDTYGDQLSKKDIEYLDQLPHNDGVDADSMDNIDARGGLVDRTMIDDVFVDNGEFFWDPEGGEGYTQSMLPYDMQGNIRVMRMFWKSRRRIKKVKRYNPETGAEEFEYFSDSYVPNENLGEEVEERYINEAWEGTMIGGHLPDNDDFNSSDVSSVRAILVNVRPRPVQYTTLDDPSSCFLGFVGTIYNLNDDKPYSMVDMMKPYNYLYDIIHYKLMDTMAASFGSIFNVDLATLPEGWKIDEWMYFAKVNHLSVIDSFREGPQGKIVGLMNNNTQKMVNDLTGEYIQQLMNLGAYVKQELGEMVGITRQREGQIANRETVGGVERSVLQSSYITERYFAIHNDVKRRELEALIETTKIAIKGRKVSFRYKLSDGSWKLMEIDGDEFSENSYGIVVDGSSDVKNLDQKLESAALAAMQNRDARLSAIMKMWTSTASLAERIKILEKSEKDSAAEREKEMQMQNQQMQIQAQAQMQEKQTELDAKVAMNREDNETKIMVAQIQAENRLQTSQMQGIQDDGIPEISPDVKAKLDEQIREFNLNLKQDDKKIEIQKERNDIARMQARNRRLTSK